MTSEVSGIDRIDDVTPGDLIAVDGGAGEQPIKVVFKDCTDDGHVVTLEDEHGETFQLELAVGAPVTMSLESKWESAQSTAPHPPVGPDSIPLRC